MSSEMPGVQDFDHAAMESNQQTVNHSPSKFSLDFKSIQVQFGPDDQPTAVITHKVVVMEPYTAKTFLQVLKENIQKYEDKFGKIVKPEGMKQVEREMRQSARKAEVSSSEKPSYWG